jgi:hypothetical protein
VAASRGFLVVKTKGQALALASHRAAVIGSAWTAEKAGTLAIASRSAASTGGVWMQAGATNLAHGVNRVGVTASAWLRSATHGLAHQAENASLILMRLNAQAKGELDALRRAAHEGQLIPPVWRRLAAGRTSNSHLGNGADHDEHSTESNGAAEPAAEYATSQLRGRVSHNALICVEPWRCQLPVVQTESRGGALVVRS